MGKSDVFHVRLSGLSSSQEYQLSTYSFRGAEGRKVAFNQGCTRATELETIRDRRTRTFSYIAYGCSEPGSSIWAELEVLRGISVDTTGDHFVQVDELPPPPTPGGLEITATACNSITLGWDDEDGVDNYRVRYGLNSPETTGSSYTATGLTEDTSYTFRVSAHGDGSTYKAEWGDDSRITRSTGRCIPDPPPDPPLVANLAVESTSRTSISLDWDSRNGIGNYRVNYGSKSPETTSSSYTATGLACGTSYTFRVSAYGDGSTYNAVWGSESTGTGSTDACPTPTPTPTEPPHSPATAPHRVPTVTLTSGDSRLVVSWSAPDDGGARIKRYGVHYKVKTSSSWTSAPDVLSGTSTTITGLTNGTTYHVRVRAKNSVDWGPWSWIVGETPTPEVRIAPQDPIVTEGGDVRFTLTASSASPADLDVNVSVAGGGSFLTGDVPSQITIASGDTTADLILQTANDTGDEANDSVVAVPSGTYYRVGSPSSTSVTVEDDDLPPAPTSLRANGHMVNGKVTLRWNSVFGATGYNVRYTEETCDQDGACGPDDSSWQTGDNITATGGPIKKATLGGLTKETLYRIEVQAVIVDPSSWSGFTLVFPTDAPLGHGTDVATAPFHGYQAKNARGSHEFRYLLCIETIPEGLLMTATDMLNAVDEWEDTVIWNKSSANIIVSTAHALPAGERCSTRAIPRQEGRFEVKFASKQRIARACNPLAELGIGSAPPACWRSESWERIGVGQIESGSVLLNVDRGIAFWNRDLGVGCRKLHEMIVHEVGHAFGIGNARWPAQFNRHPINTTHSTMSYAGLNKYCEPQAYDIVAVMGLYQSR